MRWPGPTSSAAASSASTSSRGRRWVACCSRIRWVSGHRRARALVLTMFASHVTFGAAWSVLVLYVTERLGLGAVGFGLATTVMALGGLCGLRGHGRLTALVAAGDLMRIGLIVEALIHLTLALTTTAYVAFAALVALGAHSFVGGTTARTLRRRAVPVGCGGGWTR